VLSLGSNSCVTVAVSFAFFFVCANVCMCMYVCELAQSSGQGISFLIERFWVN